MLPSMPTFEQHCQQQYQQQPEHLRRQLNIRTHTASTTLLTHAGTNYLSFASNDYLGLSTHPKVRDAFIAGIQTYGAGSGASPLVSGFTHAHHALQEALAEWLNVPACLLFSNGYMANLAVLTTLLGKEDTVFLDQENHASIWDAARLSGARFVRYPHLKTPKERAFDQGVGLLVTDGVFSISGAMANLPQLQQWAHAHKTWLMIDDAHGLGVLGQHGLGTLAHWGLGTTSTDVLMGGFGKAFGSFGAFVAGSQALIDLLIQKARPYIYTTAMPPGLACATLASLQLLRQADRQRDQLQAHILQMRQGLQKLGLPSFASETPIQSVILQSSERALALAAFLRQQGIWVQVMRPPTVRERHACCRIVLTAAHKSEDITLLLEGIAQWQEVTS
jgi:8-amino-7-oxononanoate synthase